MNSHGESSCILCRKRYRDVIMTISENYRQSDQLNSAAPVIKQIYRPLPASVLIAGLEGSTVALEFLLCATVYHFVVLNVGTGEFSWALYLGFRRNNRRDLCGVLGTGRIPVLRREKTDH